MHIVFINYANYIGCSGVHIHFLAQALTTMGITCSVYIAPPKNSEEYFGTINYNLFTYPEAIEQEKLGYFKDCIVHAWTPREASRQVTKFITNTNHVPYFVHLEDNEIAILEQNFNMPFQTIIQKASENPIEFIKTPFCSPLYFQNFLSEATGITCLIKKLEEHAPDNVPRMTFWPACEEAFFHLPPKAPETLYAELGIKPQTKIIVYPGNIHIYNKDSICTLFTALDIVNKKGYPIKLIKCGLNSVPLEDVAPPHVLEHIIDVGHPPAYKLPIYVSFSDILVQPGHPGNYDDYRFPSKIPLFLASGRPVILPKTNIGLEMKHGKNCFLLTTGTAEEIAKYICILIENPDLSISIGQEGALFARKSFSWEKSAKRLLQFYDNCLLQQKTLYTTLK